MTGYEQASIPDCNRKGETAAGWLSDGTVLSMLVLLNSENIVITIDKMKKIQPT